MSPSATVRYQARETLKGNYVAAVFSFAVLVLPIFIIIGLDNVIDAFLINLADSKESLELLRIVVITPVVIIAAVFISPLLTGFIRMFYLSGLTREMKTGELFCYFSKGRYQKTLLLNLSLVIRLMLPAVICWLPVFAYFYFSYNFMADFAETVLFLDFAFILTVMSAILLVLYALKYFPVFALYFEHEEEDIPELFRRSKRIMRLHAPEATSLIFSFTPWLLLCLTILPILYVVPYMTQSLCIGAKWMLRADNERTME